MAESPHKARVAGLYARALVKHKPRIAIAIVLGILLLVRMFWAGETHPPTEAASTDATHILEQLSREFQTTSITSGKLGESAQQIANVVNAARRITHRAPLAYDYKSDETLLAVGQCMDVMLGEKSNVPANCRVFVRREFNTRQSMVDGLSPWISDNATLATILDPAWKRVGGAVMVDASSCVICLVLARD